MRVDKIKSNQHEGASSNTRPKLAELPITFRLPKSGERDPHFGMSRSWYYGAEVEGLLSLIRLRDKGKTRGTTLVSSAAMLALVGGAGK